MFIKRIDLSDHPFIKDVMVNFSLPDNKNIGSGINYVVGKSGTGKTKFLESFLPPTTTLPTNSISRQPIDANLYQIKLFDEKEVVISMPKRNTTPNWFKAISSESSRKIEKDYLYLSEELQDIGPTGKHQKRLMTKNRKGQYYPKTFNNSGVGEARFDILMWQLDDCIRNDKIATILIEEPEAFLDPENQLKIQKLLGEISINKQLFISTHSPYIVNWNHIQNGSSIIKTNRHINECDIGIFNDSNTARLINSPGKRNPQLNGVESKNIFFSDKVFIVEGQEDVGVISDYLKEENIDFIFFGYGAGSDSKIENVLKLCNDLKYQR